MPDRCMRSRAQLQETPSTICLAASYVLPVRCPLVLAVLEGTVTGFCAGRHNEVSAAGLLQVAPRRCGLHQWYNSVLWQTTHAGSTDRKTARLYFLRALHSSARTRATGL